MAQYGGRILTFLYILNVRKSDKEKNIGIMNEYETINIYIDIFI